MVVERVNSKSSGFPEEKITWLASPLCPSIHAVALRRAALNGNDVDDLGHGKDSVRVRP